MALTWITGGLLAALVGTRANAIYVEQRAKKRSRFHQSHQRPIITIVVPGITGVKLSHTLQREVLWGNASALLKRPKHFDTLKDDYSHVLPDGSLQTFKIIPHILELMVYQELTLSLQYGCSLSLGKDLFYLDYDWRQDYRHLAQVLDNKIKGIQAEWGADIAIALIGQSMANLGIKYYLRFNQNAKHANIIRWYTFGPPWQGSFNSLELMRTGYYAASKQLVGFPPEFVTAYPSGYQLLPQQAGLVDKNAKLVQDFNIYEVDTWFKYNIANINQLNPTLAPDVLQLLLTDAKNFAQELNGFDGYESTLSQLCFASDHNQAVTNALWDKSIQSVITSPKQLKTYSPAIQAATLAIGDEHIPLAHFTQIPNQILIRHYELAPLGENILAISNKPKEHRKLVNYAANLDLLVRDFNYLASFKE